MNPFSITHVQLVIPWSMSSLIIDTVAIDIVSIQYTLSYLV